ncbi:MAG: DNA-binding protein [Rivularia sp. (in: cyanobacteria)]
MIGTQEASHLLKICTQRVRRLLKEGRILGAKKVDRVWQIPLFNGIPKVEEGSRGPKPNWRKRISKSLTRIHVNQHRIRSNQKNGTNIPVVKVQSGNYSHYYHDLKIHGSCRIVYRPHNPLSCNARLWIEVEPHVIIEPL